MTLKEYLETNGLSLKTFGERCGLSAATVLRARDGRNMPSRRTLQAIVEATNGAVTIQELIQVLPNDDYGVATRVT